MAISPTEKKNTEVSETGLMHGQYVGCGCRKKRLLKVFIIIFIWLMVHV